MGWLRSDDLGAGTPADQVTFGFEGKAYTIDLSAENRAKLAKVLQPFLTVASVYGEMPPAPEGPLTVTVPSTVMVPPGPIQSGMGGALRTSRGRGGSNAVPHAVIRQWAIRAGYSVGPKGRIPEAVLEAFHAAMDAQECEQQQEPSPT